MPTAPSKLFRIPEHTFYSEDEIRQIVSIHRAYKAQISSIQEFMKHEFYIPASQSGGLPSSFIEKEAVEDEKIFEENDRENARIAKLKNEFMTRMIKDLEDKVMEEKLMCEESLIRNAQQVNDYIEDQKSSPDSFVTPENIESMIEKAIENPVSYEYFIDASGRRYGNPNNVNLDQPSKDLSRFIDSRLYRRRRESLKC